MPSRWILINVKVTVTLSKSLLSDPRKSDDHESSTDVPRIMRSLIIFIWGEVLHGSRSMSTELSPKTMTSAYWACDPSFPPGTGPTPLVGPILFIILNPLPQYIYIYI